MWTKHEAQIVDEPREPEEEAASIAVWETFQKRYPGFRPEPQQKAA